MSAYSVLFLDPGGEQYFSLGPSAAGVWTYTWSSSVVSNAPAGRATQYALQSATVGRNFSNYQSWCIGYAFQLNTIPASRTLLIFQDGSTAQCDLRVTGTGSLFFTRNGTQIGGNSSNLLTPGAWNYIEVKAVIASGASGSMEVRVNGVVWLTVTGVNTQNTANAYANQVIFNGIGGATSWLKDVYVMADTGSGPHTDYLGDITVAVNYPNGAGVNAAWAKSVGPFTLTSVNISGVYQGTITGGASNAYVGKTFTITGFANGANNITGVCTASTATALTIGGVTTVTETHAGSAAFAAAGMVDDGINHAGTWPDADTTYISDATAGDKADFAHQALSLTGSILAVAHVSYMRKDDAGTRQVQQICLSNGTEEDSATISLGNTYQYYYDILEIDPHTSAAWTLANYNAATFGVKEIS